MNDEEESDWDFEIEFYEGLIKKKPDFIDALTALGDIYTQKGMYEQGLVIDKRLEVLLPDDPFVLYNLACSYSLMNDVDKALRCVKKAINRGYDNFEFLQYDEDLANLKRDGRFIRYFNRIRKRQKINEI